MQNKATMILVLLAFAASAHAALVGLWEFDEAGDELSATIGSDLGLSGSYTAMDGHTTGDGAVNVGPGSHFIATHGIEPNGSESYVNEWTLLVDFKYPALDWVSFFQTNEENSNDGDCFVRAGGGVPGSLGVSQTGYGSEATATETWYRMVISVDNGNHYRIYLDGTLHLEGSIQAIDGRFSLGSTLLLFADNNGEDAEIHVSASALWDVPLSESEIAFMGDVSNALPPVFPPSPPFWLTDPITDLILVNKAYTNSLADLARDANDDPITFRKDGGPAWLSVSTNGLVTGTPGMGDLGTNTFTVLASDVDGSTPATLDIFVYKLELGESTAISVNFTENNAQEQLAPDTLAGLNQFIYDNWNMTTAGTSGSQGSLVDSAGNPTASAVSWTCAVMWRDGTASSDASEGVGDAQLANGYLDDGDDGAPNPGADFTVTGIPYDQYIAVLYLSSDDGGSGTYGPYNINGSDYYGGTISQYKFPNWDASNTIIVSNLTGNLTVNGGLKSGVNRASIAGFQIINFGGPGGPVTDLVITGPVAGGTAMALSWTSENGKPYGVQTNSNLIAGNWQPFRTGITGDGGMITVTNTIGPGPTFYRVISE